MASLESPVPEKDRPTPKMETLVEVEVVQSARIFNKVKASMTQPSMLGKPVIDFTSGEEASGLAKEGTVFIGERQPGLADAVPTVMEKLDPVMVKATATLDSLQKTADNLTVLTKEGSDLPQAFAEFKKFGAHLNELSGPDSSLRRSLKNVEGLTGDEGKLAKAFNHIADITGPDSDLAKTMANAKNFTGPDGDLAKTMANAKKFTGDLADNKDISAAVRSIHHAADNLDQQISKLGPKLSSIAENLEVASDTVKRQPWRLVWPSTKKYDEDRADPKVSPPVQAKPQAQSKTQTEPRAKAKSSRR